METKTIRNIFDDRKGQLQLETVRVVMVLLLTLAVVAIAIFIGLSAVASEQIIPAQVIGDNGGEFFANNTVILTDTAATIDAVSGLDNVVLTNVRIINTSGGELVPATNFTIVAGTIVNAANNPVEFNTTNVSVSANFQFTRLSDARQIENNITSGVTDFFANMPTVFTILGVVVILGAITLILFVITRFSDVGKGL